MAQTNQRLGGKEPNIIIIVGHEPAAHKVTCCCGFCCWKRAQVTVRSQPEWRSGFFYLAMWKEDCQGRDGAEAGGASQIQEAGCSLVSGYKWKSKPK